MLVNCPRCDFSQPNDQYCAQCGVDMQAFKPKDTPLTEKIFQSTALQVIILLIAAAFVGQRILRNEEPQKWVQKISRVQTVTKSVSSSTSSDLSDNGGHSTTGENDLENLRNREIEVAQAREMNIQTTASTGLAQQRLARDASAPLQAAAANGAAGTEIHAPTFRMIYAEVNRDTLNRWINDASAAGTFQNLQDYSAGILGEFRKRNDDIQVLKVTEKKLSPTQSDTHFSGTLAETSNQMVGLVTLLEHRHTDEMGVHGSVTVTRSQRQNKEVFPAEFDLPKGSVFFMVGVLRRPSFQTEREMLSMPPFQIFKSNDFMTQKTEFVFILEPEYK